MEETDSNKEFYNYLLDLNKNKKVLFSIVIIATLLAITLSFFHEKKYSVKMVFVPQTSSNGALSSKLGGLAEFAGVSLGDNNSGEIVPPTLYEKIIRSNSFLSVISEAKFSFNETDNKGRRKTLKEYYLEKYSVLDSVNIASFNKAKHANYKIKYNKDDLDVFAKISKLIAVKFNKKENIYTITCSFKEAIVATEIAEIVKEELKKNIVDLKLKKTKTELEFLEDRYADKLKEFKKLQIELASYEDRNRFLETSKSKIKLLSLKSKYELMFGICSELQKQVESKRLQLKEETPSFMIIEPITVPSIKKGMSLITFIILGFSCGVLISLSYVYIIGHFLKIKEELKVYKKNFS